MRERGTIRASADLACARSNRMGYYTKFTLTIQPSPEQIAEAAREGVAIRGPLESQMGTVEQAIMEVGGYYPRGEEAKWYEHEEDMRSLSQRFPYWTFVLKGIGEADGDEWVKYFHSGRMQRHDRPEWELPPISEKGLWE